MEGETSNQSRNESKGVRASSCIFPFNDAASSDVVVRLMNGAGDGKDKVSKSLELHLHRSILVENSPFFSAQLSDRWEDACTRDANGRPLLVIKECKNPEDVAIALQKLYERAPGNPGKCPVHTFSSFEDALRCLEPAEQLCLSSVLSSAVDYLESIPWTSEQARVLFGALSKTSADHVAQKLLAREEPPAEKAWTDILNQLFDRSASTIRGARSILEKMGPSQSPSHEGGKISAEAFSAGLQKSLSKVRGILQRFSILYSPTTDRHVSLDLPAANTTWRAGR
jgi:hypothetical protein